MSAKQILFVDNEQAVIDAIKNLIELLGYDVSISSRCNEAIDLIRSQPERFDLVITDMNMPQMNGVELARELKKIRPELPIIICTGNEVQLKQYESGADIKGVLLKPFSTKDLVTVLSQHLA